MTSVATGVAHPNGEPPPDAAQLPVIVELMAQITRLQSELESLQHDAQELRNKRNNQGYLAQIEQLLRWQPGDTLALWADRLLQALAPMLGALHADLYIRKPDQSTTLLLQWAGSFARRTEQQPDVELGKGFVGQAAKSRQSIYLDQLHTARMEVTTGLGKLVPKALLVQPLLHNDKLEGVLEISSLKPFTDSQLDLVSTLGANIGASLNGIQSQLHIQQLYRESREQTEQLRRQEETLRNNLAALQAAQAENWHTRAELEHRARQLAESQAIAGMGSWELSPATGSITFSENLARMLGLGLASMFSLDYLRSCIEPNDLHLFDDALQQLLAAQIPMELELRFNTDEGLRYMALRARRMHPPDAEPYVLGTLQDVSDRRMQEAIIQQQNEELITREEELRQNFEELQTMQEAIRQKAAEVEKLKAEEQLNATRQKDRLRELTEKLVQKAQEKDKAHQRHLDEKDAEIAHLKAQLAAASTANATKTTPETATAPSNRFSPKPNKKTGPKERKKERRKKKEK